MLKKIVLISIIGITLFSQAPPKKWVIIQDLEDRIVYLDTTTLKTYENQLSLWGLTIFREPQRVTPFQDEVYQIKSNLLFNDVANTYNVIGTLYYDKTTRIIGESSTPRITGGDDTFELPVQPGSSIEALFNAAKNYLNTGEVEVPESEYLANTDFSKERPTRQTNKSEITEDTVNQSGEPIKLSPEQNIALIDEANLKTLQKEDTAAIEDTAKKLNSTEQILAQINDSNTKKPKPPSNRANIDDLKIEKKKTKAVTAKPTYDASSDRNVQGNYWSDGTLYVIQLSSWRRENVAQKIVDDHTAAGHNAFKMKVELPGRGTWYRVRIGYFNSLQEAREYQRTNNL